MSALANASADFVSSSVQATSTTAPVIYTSTPMAYGGTSTVAYTGGSANFAVPFPPSGPITVSAEVFEKAKAGTLTVADIDELTGLIPATTVPTATTPTTAPATTSSATTAPATTTTDPASTPSSTKKDNASKTVKTSKKSNQGAAEVFL
eukprot:CAMPEP_0179246054 /NCGR_PEP_ID=MMETSP0797-20121207/18896_1 /TAXON_ID=47934 /ORGANISM="Dinophysis acuminata, Strain DAEP01" /LENGTH=149 /DNA_ID=CAMNT_0020953631 /DNA_START=75 /DNA_END=522 /DNA_ORIENTATION=+